MRLVIQRVKEASVTIGNVTATSIQKGLLVLVGIEEADNKDDIAWLAGKISRLRVFNDTDGIMNLTVKDIGGDIIVVSQFTLHASTKKGNRPSYIRAARPATAIPLYESFISELEKEMGKKVQSGTFGAMMDVKLINEGPVTIIMDTKDKE